MSNEGVFTDGIYDDLEIDDSGGGGLVFPDRTKLTPNQDRILKIGRTLDTIAHYVRGIEELEHEYKLIRDQYQRTSFLDSAKLEVVQKRILQLTRWIKENKTTLDHLSFMLDEEAGDKDAVITSIHNRARITSPENIVATAEEDIRLGDISIQNVGTRRWVNKSVSVVLSIPDYRGAEDEEVVSDLIHIGSVDVGDSISVKDIVLKREDELSLINRGFYDASLHIRDDKIGDLAIKKEVTIQII